MTDWVYGAALQWMGARLHVSVRDLPEVVTSGADQAEALERALDAIIVALRFRMMRGEELPNCTTVQEHEFAVALPAVYAAKASLYDVWRQSGISKSELARRLGYGENEARRILEFTYPTKLDRLEAAARALGVRFTVGVAPAQPSR